MKPRTLVLALLLAGGSTCPVHAQHEPLVVGAGDLRSLSVSPEKVQLRGADQLQQIVVTGHYANGGVRDLTRLVAWKVADPKIIRVNAHGLANAVSNGLTEIAAEFQGLSVKATGAVAGTDREQPINFTNEIVPIFSKLGCNSGACHGKSTGQNGFRLSLLGFEPQVDYDALAREGRGRRVLTTAPEASLLLRKATGTMAHGGGKRLDAAARDYQTLLRWIRSGVPFGNHSDPKVTGIVVAPPHRLAATKSAQQITVTALFSDGSRRDVTADAEYSSNQPEIAAVAEGGLVETLDLPGEAAIMVRYLGHVGVFRITIPQEAPLDRYVFPPPASFIDEHVFSRLKQLGLPPSEMCSDSEFLRRVSIDITGTLPTAAEVEKFLADGEPHKREKLVDALLARPAYASYFALKWGDILRNRRDGIVGVGGKQDRTLALHNWIRDSLAANKSYDQFVRDILTARGDFTGTDAQAPVGWYNVLRTPQALVDDTAQVFLGTRIQCAQCHHHPYEKWSQEDYWGLAAYFARVQLVDPKKPVAAAKPDAKPNANYTRVIVASAGAVIDPQGRSYSRPRPLAGSEVEPGDQDPRQHLVDWMVEPRNPYFARALVNRYWAHFLGRGIVDMPDDMRVSNPPSNAPLLDALAKDFIDHKFDLKHVIRTICTSRTYQLSSAPNDYNQKDKQNFARFYPRRLPAEVLFDAVDQVTGAPLKFVSAKGGGSARTTANRAIELPDEAVRTPLLTAFGKPERSSACECERSSAATLTQSLYMIGSSELHNKLKEKSGRAAVLAADSRPLEEKVKEIYRWVYARQPDTEELHTVQTYLTENGNRKEAYEDIIWALLSTKEFLFNH